MGQHLVNFVIVDAYVAGVVDFLNDGEVRDILDLLSLVGGATRSTLAPCHLRAAWRGKHLLLVCLSIIGHLLLLDDHTIEAGIQYLDDVRMAALREDVNLSEKAFQALLLVDHVLDSHDLDGDLLLRLQVDGKLDPIDIKGIRLIYKIIRQQNVFIYLNHMLILN